MVIIRIKLSGRKLQCVHKKINKNNNSTGRYVSPVPRCQEKKKKLKAASILLTELNQKTGQQ